MRIAMREIRRAVYPISAALTGAALIIAAGHFKNDEPLPVSYTTEILVGEARDVANPGIPGSEHWITPEIPNFRRELARKPVNVPLEGFFYVDCNSQQVLTKGAIPLPREYSSTYDGRSAYILSRTTIVLKDGTVIDNAYSSDRRKALKVNKKDLDDKIQEINMTLNGRTIDRYKNPNPPDGTTGLVDSHEIFEAWKYGPGKHEVSCEFRTTNGKTYASSAEIVIFDNRS